MNVHPNEYLDARTPDFLDAEFLGLVKYDLNTHCVVIKDPRIAQALRLAMYTRV